MNETLTVKQVAEVMAVKPATVRAWLRSGKIPGTRYGRDWRIPARVVQAHSTAAIFDRLAQRLAALPADRLAALVHVLEADGEP
jgi:excisionase family DNA binding protein